MPAHEGRTRRGRIPEGRQTVPGLKMDRIKPWLFTFLGVVVSLAIINRVAFIRNLVYGSTTA